MLNMVKSAKISPMSVLSALELEEKGLGTVEAKGKTVLFTSIIGQCTAWEQRSIVEAKLQLKFYRQSYEDMKERRKQIRLVTFE